MDTPGRSTQDVEKIVKTLRDQGADDASVHRFLVEQMGLKEDRPLPRGYKPPAEIARLNQNDMEEAGAVPPSYAQQALGGIASLARDIPGAEAAQAGLRALVRRQSYPEALQDIRGAEAAAPSVVRNLNRVVGGGIAAMAMPTRIASGKLLSPAIQGATYGTAEGALSADPQSLARRAVRSLAGGTVGATVGKGAALAGTAGRALAAKTLGQRTLERTAAQQATEKPLWDAVNTEAHSMLTTPEIQAALNDPVVKPFADRTRALTINEGKTDGEILLESLKAMSEAQGKAGSALDRSPDFLQSASSLKKELGAGKGRARALVAQDIPTLAQATEVHAKGKDIDKTFNRAVDMGRRIIASTKPAPKKLGMDSPEAYLASIEKMKPEQAAASIEGLLGTIKETPRMASDPMKGYGIAASMVRVPLALWRLQPFLHALDAKAGTGTLQAALERMGISLGGTATNDMSGGGSPVETP